MNGVVHHRYMFLAVYHVFWVLTNVKVRSLRGRRGPCVCKVCKDQAQQATWRVEVVDLQGKSKGDEMNSREFNCWGHCFKLQLCPCGDDEASSGKCSLYFEATEAYEVEIRVGAARANWKMTAEETAWKKLWGRRDFGAQPDLSQPLEIEVSFKSIGGKDADALRKEAMSYYQKQAQDSTNENERLEKEAVGLRQQARELKECKSKVRGLEEETTRWHKDSGAMREELEACKSKITDLEAQKMTLQKERGALRQERGALQEKAEQLEGKVGDLEEQNSHLQERAGRASNELAESQQKVQAFQDILRTGSDAAQRRGRRLSRAAAKIQTTWRGFACERSGRAAQAALERSHISCQAATQIQALWRMFVGRKLAKSVLAERKRSGRHARELMATLQLQLAWRLYQKRLQRRWRSKVSKSQATPYDAVLAFESLAQFLSTGEIPFLQHAESMLQVATAGRFRIVAVVGLFDKGKTWLTNKLFGVNLPSGKLHTTRGLSFLWIEERRMLVLDSAGVQSTVSYQKQDVDAILDAQTTESLMFEMISRIAHHMIFVVNDLTWFEQKYVAMLHQKYVQGGQQKELVVVHNLRNTMDKGEAGKLFQRQVMRCYDGHQSHLGELIFTQDAGNGAPPLHHIGLCYEFSPAGDAFNEKNRQHLLQSLEHRNALGSELVLADVLKDELSRLLPRFVNIEAKVPEESVCTSDQAIRVEFCDAQEVLSAKESMEGYSCVGALCMKLSQEGARVAMKTRGVISPLGEIIAHDVSFDPIVNVYDRVDERGTMRLIRIECPGVTGDDLNGEELPNGVKIRVEKKPPIDEAAVQPVQPIRQHHGVWEQEFVFDYTEGRFDLCPDDATLENGVLIVALRKASQPRRCKFGQAQKTNMQGSAIGRDPDAKAPSPVASSTGSFALVQPSHSQ